MIESIWLPKSSGLTVHFQPHSPFNCLGCTQKIGQKTRVRLALATLLIFVS